MKKYILLLALFALAACDTKDVKFDATGTFEATEVTVSAEGTGAIEWLELADGQILDSGQVVGVIDTVQLHLKRRQLIASRSGAMSRRLNIAGQIGAIQQQIEWQRSEQQRFEKLVKQNAATEKQVDDIRNNIAVLRRQLTAQTEQLQSVNNSITDEAMALEVQISQVEDQIQKCVISSPIKGTVLIRYAERGEFAATGHPLFMVADMEKIYLRAYITADQLTQMKLGQAVSVYSDFGASGQREYSGVIEWISSRAEFTPKTIQTRDERANMVYAVKVAVQNDGYLKIGMYGQIQL